MTLLEKHDLGILSSKGFYRVDEVIEQHYKTYPKKDNITCRDICFLKDGKTYLVGCDKTLVMH